MQILVRKKLHSSVPIAWSRVKKQTTNVRVKSRYSTLDFGASGVALSALEGFPGSPDILQCDLFGVSVLERRNAADQLGLLLLNGQLDLLVHERGSEHQFLDLDLRHGFKDQVGLLLLQKVLVS